MTQFHFVMSAAQGGQTGKSTHILMLASHLINTDTAGTVVVIDLTEVAFVGPPRGGQRPPGIAIYDCFLNIFGYATDHATWRGDFVVGAPFIEAPVQNPRTTINLVAVQSDGQQINSWETQIQHVRDICAEFSGNGRNVSHVIVETNLQPNAPDVRLLFEGEGVGSGPLYMWACWLRPALHARGLIDDLTGLQEQYKAHQWCFVHNPHDDLTGRNPKREMPSMKLLHGAQPGSPTNVGSTVCQRAEEARDKKIRDDKYWKYVYQDYLNDRRRPRNLFPIYKYSKSFHTKMSVQFTGEQPITYPQQLSEFLNRASGKMYEEIYEPLFTCMNF